MTEHYYAKKPNTESAPQTWHVQLRGSTFTFTSDKGVFSKDKIDTGSMLMIEAFQEPSIKGDLLDLGCGYGPIGIALAHTYRDRHVILSDINERALFLVEENKRQNHIENISVVHSDGFAEMKDRTFAAIATNPPIRAGKKIVYEMLNDAKVALKKEGQLWVVIQKKQGASSAKKELAKIFGHVEVVARNKGFHIFCATKI